MSNPQMETFAGHALEMVSPFDVVEQKAEERTFRDGRKGTVYILTCVPTANRALKFQTLVFKGGLDQIRAIKFLNKSASIKATVNGKVTTFSSVVAP
jgi:hypothetical protein